MEIVNELHNSDCHLADPRLDSHRDRTIQARDFSGVWRRINAPTPVTSPGERAFPKQLSTTIVPDSDTDDRGIHIRTKEGREQVLHV